MTRDELLTEGEQYADLTGYKGDEREIAACAYMRGAMWMQAKIIADACKWLADNHYFASIDSNDARKLVKAMLNEKE